MTAARCSRHLGLRDGGDRAWDDASASKSLPAAEPRALQDPTRPPRTRACQGFLDAGPRDVLGERAWRLSSERDALASSFLCSEPLTLFPQRPEDSPSKTASRGAGEWGRTASLRRRRSRTPALTERQSALPAPRILSLFLPRFQFVAQPVAAAESLGAAKVPCREGVFPGTPAPWPCGARAGFLVQPVSDLTRRVPSWRSPRAVARSSSPAVSSPRAGTGSPPTPEAALSRRAPRRSRLSRPLVLGRLRERAFV